MSHIKKQFFPHPFPKNIQDKPLPLLVTSAPSATLIHNSTYTYAGKKNNNGTYTNLLYYLTPQDPTSLHTPAANNTPALYYDLTGRPVNPATHRGMAILKQGHNAKLSIIK